MQSIPRGLTRAGAEQLLGEHGPNELARQERPGLFARIVRIFAEAMPLLLAAAGVVTLFVPEPIDAAVLLAVLLSVSWFEIYKLVTRRSKTWSLV